MLKKMRWRFIGVAMFSSSVVILLLLLAVNLINYTVTANRQDSILTTLSQFGEKDMPSNFLDFSKNDIFQNSPAKKQMASLFFAVEYDSFGNATAFIQNTDSAITENEAISLAAQVINKNSQKGYCSEYRYLVYTRNNNPAVIFINSSAELNVVSSLFNVSAIVAIVGLLSIFGLVVLLSKSVINPYIKNIESQKRFITDASHEIKTPLTSISTSADVLAEEIPDNEWITNIQKQTVRMSKLVRNLVTLSRLDEESPFPNKADFSLSDAAWEIVEPYKTLAKAKEKEFSYHIANDLVMHGDKQAIQQMITILLDNAVKYSDKAGNIELSVYGKGKKTIIRLSNTCDLIRTDDLEHLFDRFYRQDSSRSTATGGTGIGLAIVKATAEYHGGKVSASSPDGKSIVFQIVI